MAISYHFLKGKIWRDMASLFDAHSFPRNKIYGGGEEEAVPSLEGKLRDTASSQGVMLTLIFLVNFIGVGFPWMVLPPLLPIITTDLGLTGVAEGLLIASYPLAIALFSIPVGILEDRFGARRIVTIGLTVICLFSLLKAVVPDFTWLFTLNFLTGVGMTFLIPTMPKVVGLWFPRERFGFTFGMNVAGFGLGSALIGNWLLPALGDWRLCFLTVGVIVALMDAVWWLLTQENKSRIYKGQGALKPVSMGEGLAKVIRVKGLWLALSMYFCSVGGFLGLTGFLPHMLVSEGMSHGVAALSVSAVAGSRVIGNIVIPSLSDRLGRRKPFIISFASLAMFLTYILGISKGVALWPSLILLGFILGGASLIPVLPLEMKGIGTKLAGTASGMIFSSSNAGGFIIPVIAGYIIEFYGSFYLTVIFFALVFGSITLFTIPLRETGFRSSPSSKI